MLLEDLDSWRVDDVLIDGELNPTEDGSTPSTTNVPTDTVEFTSVSTSDLAITAPNGRGRTARVRVIDAVGGLQTEPMIAEVPVREETLLPDPDEDLLSLLSNDTVGPERSAAASFTGWDSTTVLSGRRSLTTRTTASSPVPITPPWRWWPTDSRS